MNEELAEELVKEVGGGKTKFFETNVLETESIASAVKGALEWVKETGKEVGGVIAAAGVSTPAKVCLHFFYASLCSIPRCRISLAFLSGIIILILDRSKLPSSPRRTHLKLPIS
jgi:hypothetical protein